MSTTERESLFDAAEKSALLRLLDAQQERLEAAWDEAHHLECAGCRSMQTHSTDAATTEVINLRRKIEAL